MGAQLTWKQSRPGVAQAHDGGQTQEKGAHPTPIDLLVQPVFQGVSRAMGCNKSLAQRPAHWRSAPKPPGFDAAHETPQPSCKHPVPKGYSRETYRRLLGEYGGQ